MENNEDDMIPLQYLNNENPYAFCKDYHKNSVNQQDKKTRLNALQRIQPHKVNFRMPQKHLEKERVNLIEAASAYQRMVLIRRGLAILNVDHHNDPEELFEENIHIDEILDIALELKKYKLIHLQKRLRFRVSSALHKKLSEDIEYNMTSKEFLEIDNIKDALVYCKLEDLYENKE